MIKMHFSNNLNGGGGSGYNRIDHDENKYQEINQTLHFLQMLNRSK